VRITPDRDSAPENEPPTGPAAVTALLQARFGLRVRSLTRLPAGQSTVNYRARTGGGLLAAAAGVPVARPPRRDRRRPHRAARGDSAASAWEHVEGRVIQTGLTTAQAGAAGAALGTIHRTFAALPGSRGPAPAAASWLAFDADRFTATVGRLLAIIEAKAGPDEFDEAARQTLRERRAQARLIPALIGDLAPLTAQVLHGDYSAVNLMFRDDQLAAVVDFGPPDPFLAACELGRIAYDPRTVTLARDWQADASRLVLAYQREHPHAAPADIAFSARAALIQLLTSLYGVKSHYLKPGLPQDGLDAFWLLRHRTAGALPDSLPAVEKSLRAQAG
jgi:Phosphotransferase enzyme family